MAKCNKRQGPNRQNWSIGPLGLNDQVPKRSKWYGTNRAKGLKGQKSQGQKEPRAKRAKSQKVQGPKEPRTNSFKSQRAK